MLNRGNLTALNTKFTRGGNNNMYKLEIYKIMNTKAILSKEYTDDKHG